MRSIELHWLARTKLAVIALLVLALLPSARAHRWPEYGGTLRVELHALTISLDPREWRIGTPEFATNGKFAALVFDRLIALDNYGRFQPQLAREWSHDAAFKRWQFALRANVKFSDGTAFVAADVVAALQPLLPNGQQITASGSNVVIQSASAMPDLLEELASGRFFVCRVQPDGTLMGTGPFFVAEASTDTRKSSNFAGGAIGTPHLRFRANGETWAGRPFLDGIDVTLGVSPLRQLLDLQLRKADLVELSPDMVRRAMQENLRVWSSAPVTLYGLRFDDAQLVAADAKLREALALSLDRHTMANVLLQKQAEPAAALLPQWLSGYAFLFTVEKDIERAKEIRAALPPNAAAGKEPLRLRVEAGGDLPKLLGERVAVNARQAAIPLQVVNRAAARGSNATATSNDATPGLHLFAWHYSSLSSRVELESFVSTLNLRESSGSLVSSTDPEQLYAWEKKLLEERRVLPLVVLPEYVGIGPNVRDWMPARWGEWHLADVWLTVSEASAEQRGNSNAVSPGAVP